MWGKIGKRTGTVEQAGLKALSKHGKGTNL